MEAREIAQLLPDIFQRTIPHSPGKEIGPAGNVLLALLRVMETHHAPVEDTLAQLHRYFLRDQTDDSFIPFLAHWLDLGWLVEAREPLDATEIYTLRILLWQAARLSTQRGTRQGMLHFLRLATGLSGFQIKESPDRAYHIVVSCPPQADLDLVAVIVEQMKPAYVTFELSKLPLPPPVQEKNR